MCVFVKFMCGTLCDVHYKERASHYRSILDISEKSAFYKNVDGKKVQSRQALVAYAFRCSGLHMAENYL